MRYSCSLLMIAYYQSFGDIIFGYWSWSLYCLFVELQICYCWSGCLG